jgi:hypothetical protein
MINCVDLRVNKLSSPTYTSTQGVLNAKDTENYHTRFQNMMQRSDNAGSRYEYLSEPVLKCPDVMNAPGLYKRRATQDYSSD